MPAKKNTDIFMTVLKQLKLCIFPISDTYGDFNSTIKIHPSMVVEELLPLLFNKMAVSLGITTDPVVGCAMSFV